MLNYQRVLSMDFAGTSTKSMDLSGAGHGPTHHPKPWKEPAIWDGRVSGCHGSQGMINTIKYRENLRRWFPRKTSIVLRLWEPFSAENDSFTKKSGWRCCRNCLEHGCRATQTDESWWNQRRWGPKSGQQLMAVRILDFQSVRGMNIANVYQLPGRKHPPIAGGTDYFFGVAARQFLSISCLQMLPNKSPYGGPYYLMIEFKPGLISWLQWLARWQESKSPKIVGGFLKWGYPHV